MVIDYSDQSSVTINNGGNVTAYIISYTFRLYIRGEGCVVRWIDRQQEDLIMGTGGFFAPRRKSTFSSGSDWSSWLQYNAPKRGGVGGLRENRFHTQHITHISKKKKKKKSTALTWSPPNGSFLAAAETDFAEDPQEMPLAERAGIFAGAGATFRSRDPVAVWLPRLAFLPDQGAGDRGHLPEPSLFKETKKKKNESLVRQRSDLWCSFLAQKKRVDSVFHECFNQISSWSENPPSPRASLRVRLHPLDDQATDLV